MHAEQHDTRHHVYGSALWKSFVCEKQIKLIVGLRIQVSSCVLYLGLQLCFLWQNGKVAFPSIFLKQELNCACELKYQVILWLGSNYTIYVIKG